MSDEFVSAKWAKDAVQRIDRAIRGWNKSHPRAPRMAIAWGCENTEESQFLASVSPAYQQQHGLIAWGEQQVELLLFHSGDDELSIWCRIMSKFPYPPALPLEARQLYNVLTDCDEGVRLSLEPNVEEGTLDILGAETSFPLASLNPRVLADSIGRVSMSHGSLSSRLERHEGEDRWNPFGDVDPEVE